jgi:hypothetical protein
MAEEAGHAQQTEREREPYQVAAAANHSAA